MEIMTNQNACRGKVILFLVALVVLAGCQPGFAESQDIEQLRQAAEQGHTFAQYFLGVMYANGKGVPQDYLEAEKWFRKAAEQGQASAQFNLGRMYYEGKGVPEDYVKAYAWINLAASQGNKEAVEGKNTLKSEMTAGQVAEAQKLATNLFKRIESSKTK